MAVRAAEFATAPQQRPLLLLLLLLLLLGICCLLLLCCAAVATLRPLPLLRPPTPTAAAWLPSVDLVVARYNEPLDWLDRLPLWMFREVVVYNKGPDRSGVEARLAACGARWAASGGTLRCRLVGLRNVGRCDHTYLHHLLVTHDSEGSHTGARVTVFLPGSCDVQWKWDRARRTIEHTFRTGDSAFVSRAHDKQLQDLHGFHLDRYAASSPHNARLNPEDRLLPCPERPFGAWLHRNFGSDLLGGVRHVTYGGIFSVSRRHARSRPRWSYEALLRYVDGHSNPEAGHYMERAWHAVFGPLDAACVLDE